MKAVEFHFVFCALMIFSFASLSVQFNHCESDSDCDEGWICFRKECGYYGCQLTCKYSPNWKVECQDDSDCNADHTCSFERTCERRYDDQSVLAMWLFVVLPCSLLLTGICVLSACLVLQIRRRAISGTPMLSDQRLANNLSLIAENGVRRSRPCFSQSRPCPGTPPPPFEAPPPYCLSSPSPAVQGPSAPPFPGQTLYPNLAGPRPLS